ncbi:hypothetical protein BTA51_00615 [Hahella sp. CCB-MM4]|uniref:hypothetical protein n=1 Tax=Hahella sp. (strain CCB-MM4) TaxID=1926491 RepID=UPI000B9BF406|nr:hypothetical protein [Hahella sp. CCB-MM4]OZG74940.1 hypothetical protein BTA51_00615 [Hahella sp. CCB-MM4]
MRKLFTILILGPLAAYIAFAASVWYQTHRMIAAFQEATSLHLALSYGWITPSLNGEVTIEDVEVLPFQLREPIPIEAVSLKFDSLWDMLVFAAPWRVEEENFDPHGLTLSIRNAQVPLTDNWLNYASEEETSTEASFFGLACGDVEDIGLSELRDMGYSVLTVSEEFQIRRDQGDPDATRILFDVDVDGMQRSSGELVITKGRGPTYQLGERTIALPELKSITYVHEDRSYMKRVMLLCGKKANLDEPGFIDASVEKTVSKLAEAGISLSPSLVNAYRTYLKGDGVAEVSFTPAESLDVTTLPFIEGDTIAETLGFSLKLNRVSIPNASFAINIEQLTTYLYPPEPVVEEPEPKPKAPPLPTFRPIDIAELELYLDQPAKIAQHSGKVMEGTLVAVEPYQVTLEQQIQSGVVSFHIKKSDIKEVQVLQ